MFRNRREVKFERLISPVKLFPSRESLVRVSRDDKTEETEPWIRIFDKSSEITLFWKHLIPTHEQIEVGLDEFQVFKAKGMESNPCLRVSKASKSVETEEGIEKQSVMIMTNKDNIFGGFFVFS